MSEIHRNIRQKISTEGCSKFKRSGDKTSSGDISTLEHMQVPKWDRTRCPEEKASSVGMPHPLHMFYGNLAQLGKKSNSVIRSRSVMVKNWCYVLAMEGVTVCGHHPECRVTFGRGGPHTILWDPRTDHRTSLETYIVYCIIYTH